MYFLKNIDFWGVKKFFDISTADNGVKNNGKLIVFAAVLPPLLKNLVFQQTLFNVSGFKIPKLHTLKKEVIT